MRNNEERSPVITPTKTPTKTPTRDPSKIKFPKPNVVPKPKAIL